MPQAIATALDVQDFDGTRSMECVYIDPDPQLLTLILRPEDCARTRIIPGGVEVLRYFPSLFETLNQGDILYIDSSHVLKTASDVSYFIFEVLPRLNQGVIVRFGTVMYPFEYPRTHLLTHNYSWNEIYALRAFLMYNPEFEITFFNDFFTRTTREFASRDVALTLSDLGNDLWLTRRTKSGYRQPPNGD
jgi:hypothetical protein